MRLKAQNEKKGPKLKVQRTRKFSFDSDESECELPKNHQYIFAQVKDSDFLKLYQAKNAMHDGDRERATSLSNNIVYNAVVAKRNPYFNKVSEKEPIIPYIESDLNGM